jgi:hypothetical protein
MEVRVSVDISLMMSSKGFSTLSTQHSPGMATWYFNVGAKW